MGEVRTDGECKQDFGGDTALHNFHSSERVWDGRMNNKADLSLLDESV